MKPGKYTIQEFNQDFPDNSACLEYLFLSRYKTPTCPKCGRVGQYYRQDDTSHYICTCGGHQLSPKAGTIFEDSATDLYKWFFAMFLMSKSKNGVSAKELERQLGVTYKTAWRMAKQIRSLMKQLPQMFEGVIEADETYMGSRKGGVRVGGGGTKKTPVIGVTERGGALAAKAVREINRYDVMKVVKSHAKLGSELMTDESLVYSTAKWAYVHQTVAHTKKEYARGKVHTNTIEGAWSQIKLGMSGTHHSVSSKHLQSYLDYYVWHWNHRNDESPLFHGLLAQAV